MFTDFNQLLYFVAVRQKINRLRRQTIKFSMLNELEQSTAEEEKNAK